MSIFAKNTELQCYSSVTQMAVFPGVERFCFKIG